MSEAATPQARPAAAKNAHPAAVFTLFGALFLLFFVVAYMAQIQTNEAFITNAGQVNVYKPDWLILMQPVNLVLGNLSPSEAMATIFGWGIELIYVSFIIGYEMMKHSSSRSGVMMSKIFITMSWGLVGLNWWTDYNYGTIGGGIAGHIGFACMISFIVGFFGTIGIALLEHGYHKS